MSMETSGDVSHIQDEEVLRKMWQDTEDFGKKKEIRSHMYKLREERLRNFYSSDTSNESSQKITNICEKNTKGGTGLTHADSLTDHSFLSLKSKEVRDSESPTRDISYRIIDNAVGSNQGWNVVTQNEKTPGGYTTSQLATKSGTEVIEGGTANYAAKCAQKASVYNEGDDKNFVKSFETSSKNVVEQVAKGGDDTSNFQSSSSYASSSSKVVTHHQSSNVELDNRSIKSDDSISNNVIRKTYATDIPTELQNHPNYVDGNTKVTTETRTLADGSTVTTTRYETKYGKTSDSKSSNVYSTSSNQEVVQNSKSDSKQQINSTRVVSDNYSKSPKFVDHQEETCINVTRVGNTNVNEKEDTVTSTKTQEKKSDKIEKIHHVKETVDAREDDRKIVQTPRTTDEVDFQKITVISKTDGSQNERTNKKTDEKVFSLQTKTVNDVINTTQDTESKVTQVIAVNSEPTRTVLKDLDRTSSPVEKYKVTTPNTCQEKIVKTTLTTTVDDYTKKDIKDVRASHLVEESNRRISVEVSPTHEAFARSLRAVTPDRDKKKCFRSSVTSVRSSTSPDKYPSSRETSPMKRRTPERSCDQINTDTITRRRNVSNEDKFTSVATDIQYIKTSNTVTNRNKPTTLNVAVTTERNFRKVDQSPTSPVKPRNKESPIGSKPHDKVFKRRDTYEERCKQNLGISVDTKTTTSVEKSKKSPEKTKPSKASPDANRTPKKEAPGIQEFPAQIRRSPEKQTRKPTEQSKPSRASPKKEPQGLQEYPAQIRRSPEKQTRKSPEPSRASPKKEVSSIREFPAQIRRSPEKQTKSQPEPKEVYEPPFTKKYVDTRCDGDEHRHGRHSPTPKSELLTDLEQPHKTVKKDSPFKEYPPIETPRHHQHDTKEDFYVKNIDSGTYSTEYTSEYNREQPVPTKRRNSPQKEHPRNTLSTTMQSPARTIDLEDQIITRDESTTSDEDFLTTTTRKEYPTNSRVDTTYTSVTTGYDTYVVSKDKKPKTGPSEDESLIEITQKVKVYDERKGSPTRQTSPEKSTKAKPRDSQTVKTDQPGKPKKIGEPTRNTFHTSKSINVGQKVTTTVNLGKITPSISPNKKSGSPTETRRPNSTLDSTRRINKVNDTLTRSTQQTRKSTDRTTTGITEYTDKYCTVTVKPKDRKSTKLNITDLQPIILSPNRKTPEKVNKKTVLELKPQVAKKTLEKSTVDTQVRRTEVKTHTGTRQTPKRELEPEKRQVVTTTIRVQPKTKPEEPKTKTYKPASKIELQQCKTINSTDKKITRTSSQKTIKPAHPTTPIRGQSKPELLSPKEGDKKVVTSKTITLNKDLEDDKEVIVQLVRSTSSRESTPNRICPRPVLNDDDNSVERFPDEIVEPNEPSGKSSKLTDLSDYTFVTKTESIDKVDEADESLLSVNEKVNKFSNVSLDQLNNKNLSPPSAPQRPKSPKCQNYSKNETFTSVTDKISRFIKTAENVQSPKGAPRDKPISRPEFTGLSDEIRTDECLLSVSEKVNKFTNIQPAQNNENKSPVSLAKIDVCSKSPPRRGSPERKEPFSRRSTPERRGSPPGRLSPEKDMFTKTFSRNEISIEALSVSKNTQPKDSTRRGSPVKEKSPQRESPVRSSPSRNYSPPRKGSPVRELKEKSSTESSTNNKFSTTEFRSTRKSPTKETPKKNHPASKEKSPVPEHFSKRTPNRNEIVFRRGSSPLTTDCLQIETEEQTFSRTVTPKRDERHTVQNISKDRGVRREILSKTYDSTPKSGRKTPESKCTLSSVSRLRNTESMKRAKELFENIARTQTETKVVTKHNKFSTDKVLRKDSDSNELKSTRLIMGKLNGHTSPTRVCSPSKSSRSGSPVYHSRERSESPSYRKPHDQTLEDVPHYMWPLNRAPHEKDDERRTPSRGSSPDAHSKLSRGSTPERTVPGYMKPLDRQSKSREKSCEKDKLKSVVITSESRLKTKFGITLKRTDSGRRVITTTEDGISNTKEIENIFDLYILEVLLEQATTYEQRRKIRAQIRIVKQSLDEKNTVRQTHKERTPDRSPDKYKQSTQVIQTSRSTATSSKTQYEERRSSVETKKENQSRREKSPDKCFRKIETKSYFKENDFKRTTPASKTVVDDKPSWVTQKTLKKPSDVTTTKRTSSMITSKSKTVKSSSSIKEQKPIDLITSGYGVGPTDENGRPLFGLKALRAQNKTDTTKVQGTVISSHYYSEDGQEPTGEVTVTKYSSEPNDFEDKYSKNDEGILSVTTTQKFGSKGTPSYKTLLEGKYSPDLYENESEYAKTTTRRGSVKELSKKYDETTSVVETTKCEKSSGYPKAGLILRSSSFKNDRRGSSPDQDELRTMTVTSEGRVDTFLTNRTRITGVQDVITRMKNSDLDNQDDESPEDKEARNLLNKFIGSQVLLSGMESCASSSPAIRNVVKTTTTTTTITKEGEEPIVISRTFTHPITEEELATVWDIDTLKLLLERSTEYEERRIIRSRLRDVMAEQKVCDDVVSQSKEEKSERVEETSQGTLTQGSTTTARDTTKKVSKPMSPFAKFRQLDKQNSVNTPPGTPRTPTGSAPLFKFTDPELNRQAMTVKERLLQWCQMKTKEYENIQLDNFSSSWADGLAFCALIHHFLPEAFDYHKLTPKERRHNFTLAFRIADEKADIMPLLDVDDMVATRKPDWKCVFTYVQTIYSRFKNED